MPVRDLTCGVARYYSGMSARLAGHDNVAYLRVLQAPRYVQVLLGNTQAL
jgi:hypothetical protein